MNRRFIRDLVFILGLMCLPGIAPAFASRSETVPSYMPMLSDFNGDNQVDQVTLNWTAATGAQNYSVLRGNSNRRQQECGKSQQENSSKLRMCRHECVLLETVNRWLI